MPFRPIVAGIAVLAFLIPIGAAAFETRARAAMAVDSATGMVLMEKNQEEPMPTASMSKLMTLYMLFEAIRDGRVTEETEFRVSQRAQSMGGSRMFAEAGTMVSVDALIHGIIVQSGNDACVVVAENLAGTEEEFARQATARAHELGLAHTNLRNASGWPEPGHAMSAEDLVALARRIIDEFPEFYSYFSQTEYTWNGITQQNRNPLLHLGIGADGLKTGHTSEAGYGLVGSAVQNGQRIVFVLMGLDSVSERASEAEAVVNWAFNAFDTVKFYDKGAEAAMADVWLGQERTVPLVAPADIQMLVPRTERGQMTARIVYDNPVEAPIQAGQVAGALLVDVPGRDELRFDLVAGRDVPRGGLMTRIEAAAILTRNRAVGLIARHD
jgi:serine-type D-Ala-D-Ala carboxypeptidase (penicillin-binding protein 5/6)